MRVALLLATIAGGLSLLVSQSAFAAPEIWRSDGYGYVVSLRGKSVATYDITTVGCVAGPKYKLAAFEGFYGRLVRDDDGKTAWLDRPPTVDRVRRLAALPEACRRPLRSDDPRVVLDTFIATFAEHYPFFAARGADWTASAAKARAGLDGGADLFDTLVALAAPLGDNHVSITAGDRIHDPDPVAAPGVAPDGTAWTRRALRGSLRDYLMGPSTPLAAPAAFAGERRVLYGRFADGTGYLAILAQGGWGVGLDETAPASAHIAATARVLDTVLFELKDAPALVIDLRENTGGFDAVSLEIAARFVDKARVAWRKKAGADAAYDVVARPSGAVRYGGRLAVLIGPNTVSAGESMAQSFAVMPQATLIGRAPRGAWSDAIPKTLPNGWTFTMSIEQAFTPDGVLLEVAGVRPDVESASPTSADPASLWGQDIAKARATLHDDR